MLDVFYTKHCALLLPAILMETAEHRACTEYCSAVTLLCKLLFVVCILVIRKDHEHGLKGQTGTGNSTDTSPPRWHTYKDNSFNGTTGLMLCFKSKSVIAGHRCESMYLLFLKRNKGAVLNTKPLQSVLAADCARQAAEAKTIPSFIFTFIHQMHPETFWTQLIGMLFSM